MNPKFEPGSKEMWIGRHSADQDTLIFDPAAAPPGSRNVTFFSLTHLRTRSFTPAAAQDMIQGITDPKEVSEAKRTYKRWPELKAKQDEAAGVARSEAIEQRRADAIERHQAFLATLPAVSPEAGPKPAKPTKRRRAANCSVCRRALDTGLNLECAACTQPICTCGACACGVTRQGIDPS